MQDELYDDETIVIAADTSLKDKARARGNVSTVDMEAIARAERALQDLACEFDGWLSEEVDKLVEAREAVRRDGVSDERIDTLYRAAHDLKGEGETLGYPLVTKLCALLCKLLDAVPEKSEIPMSLVDNHVDAVRVVQRDGIKGDEHTTTNAVIERLSEVVADIEEHYERIGGIAA